MKKRILALLLCCAIAFTVIPFLPASAEEASVEQETVSEPEGIPAGTPAEDGEDAGDAEADLTEPLPAVIPDNTSDLPVES